MKIYNTDSILHIVRYFKHKPRSCTICTREGGDLDLLNTNKSSLVYPDVEGFSYA